MEHEVRSLTQGQPIETRSRDDLLQEGPLPNPAARPDHPGTPAGLDENDITLRSRLATSLRPSAFPADRDLLLQVAAEEHAPEEVLSMLDGLPAGRSWDRLEQVWEALGGPTEHREGAASDSSEGGAASAQVRRAGAGDRQRRAGLPTVQATAVVPAAVARPAGPPHPSRPARGTAKEPARPSPQPAGFEREPAGFEPEPAGSEQAGDRCGPASLLRSTHVTGVPLEAVLPGLAVLDAVARPDTSWDEIGESRRGWLARIVLIPGLGAWRYASSIKPRLQAAETARNLAGG